MVPLFAFAMLFFGAAAITTKIEPGMSFCIKETGAKDQQINFNFNVVAGGKQDLDVRFSEQSGSILRSWSSATEGDYSVTGNQERRVYQICFSNEMSRFTPKWVSFNINKALAPELMRKKDIDPVEQRIKDLKSKFDQLTLLQQRFKQSQKDLRSTIESSNDRILLWSVFEVVALFGMGIFQVWFLKRYLDRKANF